MDRAGDQGDCRARLRRGARDCETHLAARVIRDAAHRIDRLERRPGGDQQPLAGQPLRLEERDQFIAQFDCFEHAPVADLAARLIAAVGA